MLTASKDWKRSVNKKQRNQLIQRKSAAQSCTSFNGYRTVTIDKADYGSDSAEPGKRGGEAENEAGGRT